MAYEKIVFTDELPSSTPIKYSVVDDSSGSIATSAKIEIVTPVTAGTPINAANMNHIEDGIDAAQTAADAAQVDADAAQSDVDDLNSAIFTGAGAGYLPYFSGPTTIAKKAPEAGRFLRVGNDGVSFEYTGFHYAHGCQRYKTTQSIPTATLTNLTFDSVNFDYFGFSSGSDKLIIPPNYSGLYLLCASCKWDSSAAYKYISIYVDGGFIAGSSILPSTSANTSYLNVCVPIYLIDGKEIVVKAWHAHGSNLNCIYANLSAVLLGRFGF